MKIQLKEHVFRDVFQGSCVTTPSLAELVTPVWNCTAPSRIVRCLAMGGPASSRPHKVTDKVTFILVSLAPSLELGS